ncbi:MAG: response regulator [Anaerolineales bacterium]|nr:response regulator [Anaerolineales bacterium]
MAEGSIFIIDDEEGIVRLCTRLLSRANYDVDGISDPAVGVERLGEFKFDLLLVDIRMPGMDGFAVIDQVRQLQPEIAVVIMTGYGTLETAIKALRQGADGLILKPFEKGDDLVRTVQDALKARREKQEISRLRAIRPLLWVAEKLFSETRTETLVGLILETIKDQLDADHAMIYHRKAGDSFISLVGETGWCLPEEHARASGGIVARADHWDVPIWVNREGPGSPDFQELLIAENLTGVICIPVRRGGSSMVFAASRGDNKPGFNIADVEMFGLLSRQADIALENARLYEDLRDSLRQIEQSQRALIQAEKMSAVGRLTASIAHEVNNPLQAVQNCLHLSQREELSKEKQAEYLEMADEELARLMHTVQRMLEFYRPGAMKKTPTDIVDLVEKVLALLDKQLRSQEVKIQRDFPPDLPFVPVVSNQIQQVFFNLVLNAMDVMPDGGTIKISAAVKDDVLHVDFQDCGPGVIPEMKDTIFEPFVSSGEEGTGLGLSVSYGILTAHNGALQLIENDQPGACFRVTIPMEVKK